jgi:hypothetical protein
MDDAAPDEEVRTKVHLAPGTTSAPPEDAVPISPWTFRRVNEHGHVHVEAKVGTVTFDPGDPLPMPAHARIYLGKAGQQVGTAVTYPNGRVVGTIKDPLTGSKLIHKPNFLGITATWNTITIDDVELNA